MIQIREAHASDVWPIGNIINVKEHRNLSDRLDAAREMVKNTWLEIPVLADTMDDTFLKLYAPWPFRFFVIVDGTLKLIGMRIIIQQTWLNAWIIFVWQKGLNRLYKRKVDIL
ncbi:unnamed protein product [Rhizophagus irregularis]|nr:unnamed protein product [Rhizophagus irregularis]